MKKKEAPVFNIREHCRDVDVKNVKVASFSKEVCAMIELEENHRHEHYEIIWLRKGKGVHNIDMKNYPYSGSVLFLLSPGQMHQIKAEVPADGYVVKFMDSLFSDTKDMEEYLLHTGLFDNIQAQPMIKVSSSAHTVFEDLLKKMETEFCADEEDKEKILVSYLKIFITHINRLKKSQANTETVHADSQLHLFQQYKTTVEKNFRREHGVQQYADKLYTQARTLNALAKKYAGKTAGEIIADRIILEAKREMYYNRMSIKEIAYSLGFDDPAYFTRFFKKQTGISPQEYKSESVTVVPVVMAV